MRPRRLWRLALVGASLAVLVGAVGCSSSNKETRGDDRVIGEPPDQNEDPFQLMSTPDDASSTSSSGYIGPDEEAEEEQEADKESPETDESVAVETTRAEPEATERKLPPKPEAGKGVRCFSCVRICPIETAGRGADCSGDERDVICGWGVHETKADASRLARAECDGALDMARRMKTWSRIDGECPAATCR